MSLNVNEIFYSLQGEGGRQGEASVFIRLSGCNLNCDFCDTDSSTGKIMSCEQILEKIIQYPCRWIVWTGGEPTLQLNDDCVDFFKQAGFSQAIESNGHNPLPKMLNYTAVSPKGNTDYAKINNPHVDEIRMTIRKNDILPAIESLPKAKKYLLSPIFSKKICETKANINWCVEQVKLNTQWKLSLQIHKLIGID